jgi:hypothetical protein
MTSTTWPNLKRSEIRYFFQVLKVVFKNINNYRDNNCQISFLVAVTEMLPTNMSLATPLLPWLELRLFELKAAFGLSSDVQPESDIFLLFFRCVFFLVETLPFLADKSSVGVVFFMATRDILSLELILALLDLRSKKQSEFRHARGPWCFVFPN